MSLKMMMFRSLILQKSVYYRHFTILASALLAPAPECLEAKWAGMYLVNLVQFITVQNFNWSTENTSKFYKVSTIK